MHNSVFVRLRNFLGLHPVPSVLSVICMNECPDAVSHPLDRATEALIHSSVE